VENPEHAPELPGGVFRPSANGKCQNGVATALLKRDRKLIGGQQKSPEYGWPAHECTYVPAAIAGQDCEWKRERLPKKMATSRRYRLQATYVCTRNNMCDVCPAVWKPLSLRILLLLRTPRCPPGSPICKFLHTMRRK